jgi:hypothetical protein
VMLTPPDPLPGAELRNLLVVRNADCFEHL